MDMDICIYRRSDRLWLLRFTKHLLYTVGHIATILLAESPSFFASPVISPNSLHDLCLSDLLISRWVLGSERHACGTCFPCWRQTGLGLREKAQSAQLVYKIDPTHDFSHGGRPCIVGLVAENQIPMDMGPLGVLRLGNENRGDTMYK